MHTLTHMARVLGTVGLAAVVSTTLAAQSANAIEQGQKVYASNRCQICHSIEGKGNAKGSLDGVGKKRSAEEIRAWMTDAEGMTAKTKSTRKPLMKSYPNMAKADLDALVAYMQSLK